jgi:ferredoxin
LIRRGGIALLKPKKITLVYYSGTGCTKEVCLCFAQQLAKKGLESKIIGLENHDPGKLKQPDLLVIFSPVYAFRLASITEKWVKGLPKSNRTMVAIVPVSGGGDISPNTACTIFSRRILKKKGYHLIYERMIVMPSNFGVDAGTEMNQQLIHILPEKAKEMIEDILTGEHRFLLAKPLDRFLAMLGKGEHLGARFFGASIHPNGTCTHCGQCSQKCPTRNIKMDGGMPKFGFRCILCLRCIYCCPVHALKPGILSSVILKDGFHLQKLKKQESEELSPNQTNFDQKGAWKGVSDYLE